MRFKRNLIATFAFACCLFYVVPVTAADGPSDLELRVTALESKVADLADSQPIVMGSVEASVEPAHQQVDRESIAKAIIQSSKDSDLSRRKKRRVQRVMNAKRGRLARAREQAIDMAASEMLTAGVIVATPDGIEAAIDLDAILGFLEGLLPILLQLFQIFGG